MTTEPDGKRSKVRSSARARVRARIGELKRRLPSNPTVRQLIICKIQCSRVQGVYLIGIIIAVLGTVIGVILLKHFVMDLLGMSVWVYASLTVLWAICMIGAGECFTLCALSDL